MAERQGPIDRLAVWHDYRAPYQSQLLDLVHIVPGSSTIYYSWTTWVTGLLEGVATKRRKNKHAKTDLVFLEVPVHICHLKRLLILLQINQHYNTNVALPHQPTANKGFPPIMVNERHLE